MGSTRGSSSDLIATAHGAGGLGDGSGGTSSASPLKLSLVEDAMHWCTPPRTPPPPKRAP
eukprot:1242512-Prymnesium_polylepis.1